MNYTFGDELQDGTLSDSVRSNNGDGDKVLMTVAMSVLRFFGTYPDAMIVFKGSTDSRTRKYTMQISKHRDILSELVVVEGQHGLPGK